MRKGRRAILPAIGYLGGMAIPSGLLGWQLLGAIGAVVLILGTAGSSGDSQLRRGGAVLIAPWQAPELFEEVRQLARRAQLATPPRLLLLPTPQPNAVNDGTRGAAAVGVTTGLLQHLNRRELRGVLAHELAHIRNNDIWLASLAGSVRRLNDAMSAFGLFGLLLALPALLLGIGLILPALPMLLLVAPIVSGLLQLALSRSREFEADRTAVTLAGDSLGLVSALSKLNYANRSLMAWLGWPRATTPN